MKRKTDLPDFTFENRFWNRGTLLVAGADEVGRGSFAGPVVAGAVIFPRKFKDLPSDISRTIINDSKKMSPDARLRTYFWIRKNVLSYGIGVSSTSEINRFGIKKAAEIAFRKAIKNLGKKVEFLLVDAFYIPYLYGLRRKNQLAIVHGDEKSLSIAAASIIAKVFRDKMMAKLGVKDKFVKYGWAKNKGYGTKDHRDAIISYGTTVYHRKQFVETFLAKNKNPV